MTVQSLYVRFSARFVSFFFLNDTASPNIYTLSLHDALPISPEGHILMIDPHGEYSAAFKTNGRDRKSTRLNSSHVRISYAVFCLKKKNQLQAFCHLFWRADPRS